MRALRNIAGVARYERIMLMRTTRFRALGVVGIAFPVVFGIALAIAESRGGIGELPSALGLDAFVPFYLYTYVQSVVIAFVAGGFRAADEQAQVEEVIAARPLSTAELVIGKYLGVVQSLTLLSLSVIGLTLAIQAAKLSLTGTPFLLAPYLAYFFLMTLPALIFMSALVFCLGAVLKNRTAVALVSIAYVLAVLFFLGTRYGGIFDFGAFFAPLVYSDLLGLGDITRVIEIRIFYLALAAALLGFAVIAYPRLPQSGLFGRMGPVAAAGGLAVAVGVFVTMARHDAAVNDYRSDLFATQIQHGDLPVPSVVHYDIDVDILEGGVPLRARVAMQLVNENDIAIDPLIFTLNPGLLLTGVSGAGGNDLPFEVDGSVVRVGLPMAPGAEASLSMSYCGDIDRDAFDLLRRVARLEKRTGPIHKGDLTAWIRDESVFLPPRSRWYPVPGVDYGNDEGRPVFFYTAQITVEVPGGLEVVTQGVPSVGVSRGAEVGERGRSVWTVDTPVPQLSLNVGRYEVLEAEAGDTTVALYVHPSHLAQVMGFEDATEEVLSLVEQMLRAMAQETGLPYPYPRLSVVEIPFLVQWYYEGWEENGGLTQPGILMLEEDVLVQRAQGMARLANRILSSELGRNQEPASIKRNLLANTIFSVFLASEGQSSGLFRSPLVQLWSFNRRFGGDNSPLIARGMPVYLQEDKAEDIRIAMFQRGRGGSRGAGGGFGGRGGDRSGGGRGPGQFRGGPGGPGGRRKLGEDATWDEMLAAMQQSSLAEMDPEADPDLYRSVLDVRGITLFRMIEAVVGDDRFTNALEAFGEASEFGEVTLDAFEQAMLPEGADEDEMSRESLDRLIGDWLYGSYVPGYTLTRTEAKKVEDGWGAVVYQVMVRIRNGEPGRGFVQVELSGRGDQITKNVEIDGGQEVEVSMIISTRPSFVTVEPFLAKNRRALRSPLRIPEEVEAGSPEEYVRVVTGEEAASTEIIVDNEDDGFSMPVRRVQRYLRPELEGGNWNVLEHRYAFGRYETNFRSKSGADGAQPAQWAATIPHSGYYDVAYYFLPRRINGRPVFFGAADTYRFTISHGGERTEMAVQTDRLQPGWNQLGRLIFEAGQEATVELADLGDGRIYADAVRWRYIDPESPNAVYDEGLSPWESGGPGGFGGRGGPGGGGGGRRGD